MDFSLFKIILQNNNDAVLPEDNCFFNDFLAHHLLGANKKACMLHHYASTPSFPVEVENERMPN